MSKEKVSDILQKLKNNASQTPTYYQDLFSNLECRERNEDLNYCSNQEDLSLTDDEMEALQKVYGESKNR